MTDPIDEDFLTTWAKDRQRVALEAIDKCRRCTHGFHGLGCKHCACPGPFEEVAG